MPLSYSVIPSVAERFTKVNRAAKSRDPYSIARRQGPAGNFHPNMEPPTKPMLKEAAEAGFYQPPGLIDKYPRIQILSIAELLVGKKIEYPRLLDLIFKKAPKARNAAEEQIPLAGTETEDEGPF